MLDPDLPKLKEELIPYDFDARPQSPSKPPPHWLLLDHTVAVLWSLYNQEHRKDNLNIEQLKRAHGFLKGIRNEKGDNPKDIKKSLALLEDKMIESYAGLMMESKDNKKGKKEKVSPLEITIISKADPEMFTSMKIEQEKQKEKVKNENNENPSTALYKDQINSDVFPMRNEKVSLKKGRKLNQRSDTDFNEYIEKLLEKRNANNLYWNSK